MKKLLHGGTWEETTGGSHTTCRNFHLSSGKLCEGQKRRLNEPHLFPWLCGKVRLRVDFQHFGSDQESLTRMQATNPAGHRQPGAGNNSHSHTDITEPHTPLTRLGMERLQNMETVLLAQVCTKHHTPDDQRSGEGILQVNIFKRNPFSLEEFAPQI